MTTEINRAKRIHFILISRQLHEFTKPWTPGFHGVGSSGSRQRPFLWRTLSNGPGRRNQGMAFLIERWVAVERKFRSLGSAGFIFGRRLMRTTTIASSSPE